MKTMLVLVGLLAAGCGAVPSTGDEVVYPWDGNALPTYDCFGSFDSYDCGGVYMKAWPHRECRSCDGRDGCLAHDSDGNHVVCVLSCGDPRCTDAPGTL